MTDAAQKPLYAQLVEFETAEGNKAYFIVGEETADAAVATLRKELKPGNSAKIEWRWAVRTETSKALNIQKGQCYTL